MFVRVSDGELDADVLISGMAAAPNVTWGSANLDGSASSVIRTDATLRFPPALIPVSGTGTVTLTESGSDGTLTYSGTGALFVQLDTGPFSVRASSGLRVIRADVFPDNGNTVGIVSDLEDGTINTTIVLWSANASLWQGVLTTAIIRGIDNPLWSFTPTAGSNSANTIQGGRFQGATITNTNAGFTRLDGIYVTGPSTSVSTIAVTCTIATGATFECPTISEDLQIGVDIIQRTAMRTATDRIGLRILAQNSGTNRYSIKTETDKCLFGGEVEIDGNLNHDGSNVGFYGVAPVARSSAYSPTNVTTDRSYDANSTTVDELADVLATLIADLQLTGIIG